MDVFEFENKNYNTVTNVKYFDDNKKFKCNIAFIENDVTIYEAQEVWWNVGTQPFAIPTPEELEALNNPPGE